MPLRRCRCSRPSDHAFALLSLLTPQRPCLCAAVAAHAPATMPLRRSVIAGHMEGDEMLERLDRAYFVLPQKHCGAAAKRGRLLERLDRVHSPVVDGGPVCFGAWGTEREEWKRVSVGAEAGVCKLACSAVVGAARVEPL
eukprot:152393-Chlamydomonas_euryale.AAC.1